MSIKAKRAECKKQKRGGGRVRGVFALLGAALLLLSASCQAAPAPSAPPADKNWCIYANEMRLSRFSAGEDMLIWACTLNLALYKQGGAGPEGAYTGRLMLTSETDCYEGGLYSARPACFGPEGLPPRSYAWSAPLTLTLEGSGAGGAGESAGPDAAASTAQSTAETALETAARWTEAAAGYDLAARTALGMAAGPAGSDGPGEAPENAEDSGYTWGTGNTEDPEDAGPVPDGMALYDVDDFGDALPAFAPPAADESGLTGWRTQPAYISWEAGYAPLGWPAFSSVAGALAREVGFEALYMEEPVPHWAGGFGEEPQNAGAGALPFRIEIAPDGGALIWLAGFAPLEAARPFMGHLQSGGSLSASMPAPPNRLPAADEAGAAAASSGIPAADTQSAGGASAQDAAGAKNSGPGGEGAEEGGDAAGPFAALLEEMERARQAASGGAQSLPPEEDGAPWEEPAGEVMSALEEALAERRLPLPPGELRRAKRQKWRTVYAIEGISYYDITAYARKLKMGGYRTVLSETEEPILDFYSLVARRRGRILAILYRAGEATMTVY